MRSVQNAGGHAPRNRMRAHVAKVVPRQRFAKFRGNFQTLRKHLFGHVRPTHHAADQLFHIYNGGDQQRFVHQRRAQRGHREKCADAVGDQRDTIAARPQSGKKRREFFYRFPWGLRAVIKADYFAIGEQGHVMLGFRRRTALSMHIYDEMFHMNNSF